MKKFLTMLLTLALLLSTVSLAAALDEDNPVYIGMIDAMTGDKAMAGQYAFEAVQMFVEHKNAQGGVLGRKLVVVLEDDQGAETTGVNAFQKITAENELSGIVLGKYSAVVLAMEEFISEEGIPSICAGSSSKVANTDSKYLYSTRKSDNSSGVTIAKLAQELGMTKVGIIHAPDALGTGMTPILEEQFKNMGIEVVSVQQFNADEKNFDPYIAKLKASGADGIIDVAQQVEAALVMVAVKNAGLDNLPRIGSSATAQQTAISNAAGAADGWYSVTNWSPTIPEEPAKSWIAEYNERYGHAPDMGSALAYDALSLLCDAIERANSDDPEAVNEAMRQTKGYVGLGSTYTFTEGTSMLATTEFVTKIENGISTVLKTLSAE